MQAGKKIAVPGATGRVGRHVVDVLTDAGHDVVAMSRSNGVDVVSGEGLAKALAGVECVIDVASGPSRSRRGGRTDWSSWRRRSRAPAGARLPHDRGAGEAQNMCLSKPGSLP